MFALHKYIFETKKLLIIAIPVILTQITQTAMSFVDTIMTGTASSIDMAVIAVGSSIWFPTILFGHGLLLSLTPVIAQLHGANKNNNIFNKYINQAYWLAIFASCLIMLILWNSYYLIKIMHNINILLKIKVIKYLRTLLWGVPGYLFYQVMRNQYEGQSRTKPVMIISFIGLIFNIIINYIFIYGNFGMPAMGCIGCGIATSSVYWIMFLIILIWFYYNRGIKNIKKIFNKLPNIKILLDLIKLGLPIAFSLMFEVSLFAIVAILLSPLGIVEVSGHQIALNFSSLLFVLPFSIGIASTIRIGYNIGRNKINEVFITGYCAHIIGIILALFTASFSIFFRNKIVFLYSNNLKIIKLATKLILFSAIYQFPDAIQAIGSGILRGYKDTKTILFITFFAYWIVGLPIGYIFALTDIIFPAMGPVGFWYGFIIGLSIAAIMIFLRIIKLQRLPNEIIRLSSKN
ncbi:MATE family efflux transporter [Candidatus Purcelliella pentastirinorum]|uniref:MATE family efflux transporter n=1 Tax=Candidatus Purcelliella pentastirinorum TaxID=472834 RepID=UPI0023685400|nr:MATE family efflux transporter [Candidatus Purcelliella pentastirinorum]WDI78992.1 MATE family efflux transporter [Candidatus Purcelliella pentastirinorum]WDR80129.1 MATE family efflux transporter [Candidatus Purcelliella pentastirinorum]